MASWPLDVRPIFTASLEELRTHLEARLGTADFAVTDKGFILRLPDVDPRRPTDRYDLVDVEVPLIDDWTVAKPRQGPFSHVVPRGSTHTWCTIALDSWSAIAADDTWDITCPLCRVRFVAMEIVAPPGPRRRRASLAQPQPAEPPVQARGNRIVAERGIALTVREIKRRGGEATRVTGGRARNQLRARGRDGRDLVIDVRTRRAGDWQSSTDHGRPRSPDPSESAFWIFVDLIAAPEEFYVVPLWWIENDIHDAHSAYLARHGGKRAVNPDATHHRIPLERIADWKGRWDLLGL